MSLVHFPKNFKQHHPWLNSQLPYKADYNDFRKLEKFLTLTFLSFYRIGSRRWADHEDNFAGEIN